MFRPKRAIVRHYIKIRSLLPKEYYYTRSTVLFDGKVKVKESRNRPGVAQRVPGGLGSQISWHSAHDGGDVVSLTHRPPLPPGNVPGTHFHQGLSRPQGQGTVGRYMSLKNPMTPPGIDPGTVRLVAQRLNHYATPGPGVWRYPY
jgi:hypothetical protein